MGKAETGKEVGMNGMIHKPAERESVLLQAYREELVHEDGNPSVVYTVSALP